MVDYDLCGYVWLGYVYPLLTLCTFIFLYMYCYYIHVVQANAP